MYLNGAEVSTRGLPIVLFLGWSTSFCYRQHVIALSNHSSVFQKCNPVVYARLGLWKDDCGDAHQTVLISTSGLTLCLTHWEVLSLNRYEKMMPLIGYCIIANQLWYKHVQPQRCGFSRHTNVSQKGSALPFVSPQCAYLWKCSAPKIFTAVEPNYQYGFAAFVGRYKYTPMTS